MCLAQERQVLKMKNVANIHEEFIENLKLLMETNYRKMLKEKRKDLIRKEIVLTTFQAVFIDMISKKLPINKSVLVRNSINFYTGKIPTRKEILKIDAIWGLSNNKKDKITVDYNTETFKKITEIAAKTNLKYSQVIRYFLTIFLVKNIDFDDKHLFMKL